MAAVLASIDNGTYIAPSKQTVGQWMDTWAETYLGGVKPHTVVSLQGTDSQPHKARHRRGEAGNTGHAYHPAIL